VFKKEEIDIEGSSNQVSLHRQFADIKVIDYICGYAGNRSNNISCQLDDGNPPKITAIRSRGNNICFGPDSSEKKENPYMISLKDIRNMSKKTAEMLQKLDRKTLESILRAHQLSEDEIEAAFKRTEQLQQQMINNFNNMYIIESGVARDVLFGKENSSPAADGILDFFGAMDLIDTAVSALDNYNHSEHITRDNEIVVADKKIADMKAVLETSGKALDDGKHYGKMIQSLDKLQNMSKEIIGMFSSTAPDKKEQIDKKHYEYEKELNVFKLHTAEYLLDQRNQFTDAPDDKTREEIQKKIEVAVKLQEKVQKIQDDMVDAFNAEMQAEVMRILEASKQAEMNKQKEKTDQPIQTEQPKPQEKEEIAPPEIKEPELGDNFELNH
ncbi:MAG: hypothetical protein IKV72_00455, partial [Firmicutes bacterium]|nr:hypothetical protein [Bacillota bacterium]